MPAPLTPSTRDKLKAAGTAAVAAALAERGFGARYIDGLHRLSSTQDRIVGEACASIQNCRAGAILIVDAARPSPPVAQLVRRGVSGIVGNGRLRAAAEIVRAGLPAYERRTDSPEALAVPDGEVLVGDDRGLIVVPAAFAEEIADAATEAIAFEEFTAEQVAAGGGVYGLHIPSGEQARIAFAAWRRMKGR